MGAHLGWFLFGALAGSTVLSIFWCWVLDLERQQHADHARLLRAQSHEADMHITGLYRQIGRLDAVILNRLAPPDRPVQTVRLTWPTKES